MIYLFLTYCFFFSLLFFLPPPLHKPLKQGLFLFSFVMTGFSLAIDKIPFLVKLKPTWFEFLRNRNPEKKSKILWLGVTIVLCSFLYHGFLLSLTFATQFQFHDADYVGMQEVIRNLLRGKGYLSTYYSVSGEGSYLEHHFSPALFFFLPFELFLDSRWGYAIGVYFYLCLGVILWTSFFLSIRRKQDNREGIELKYLVILALLFNIYLYRLGTSFHFEVLVVPFSAVFFSFLQKGKFSLGLVFSLLLFLMIKEDIGIYLMLFLLPITIKSFFSQRGKLRFSEYLSLSHIKTNPLYAVLLIALLYLTFVFFLYPWLMDSKSEKWISSLSREYRSDFKQVTGLGKSIQIFLELLVSMGLGFIGELPAMFGISLIYLTHAFSTRPWHHEVYSYYCYTILPFLLYASAIWIREKKVVRPSLIFLFLSFIFYRNVQDSNFPIKLNPLTPTNFQKIDTAVVKLELVEAQKLIGPKAIVFSQYNLSFFTRSETLLYPLAQIRLKERVCVKSDCYLLIAPSFTEERLVQGGYIQAMRDSFLPATKLYQGKWVELWKSN